MISKQMLLQHFEAEKEAYRSRHSATAEMDAVIFRSYCAGKTALQIAKEMSCSESTVYGSISRVQEYLCRPYRKSLLNMLVQQVNDGDRNPQSLSEMLYTAYTAYNPIDIGCAKTGFVELLGLLSILSDQSLDNAMNLVCDLCQHHERSGFTEGVRLGLRLGSELLHGMEV